MESAATVLRIDEPKLYRTRRPERSPFYAVLHHYFDRFTREYEHRFERTFGPLRGIVTKTVERYLDCGLPENGFARVRCDACKNEYLVAFSCKQLWFLSFLFHQARHPLGRVHPGAGDPPRPPPASKSSRSQKSCVRPSEGGDGFSPNSPYASGKPSFAFLREDTGNDTLPAAIVSIQTAGKFLNWHPHLHVLAPAGAFRADGGFVHSIALDTGVLRGLFQANVLTLLLKERMISQELVERMRQWRHLGISCLRRYLAKGIVPDHGEEGRSLRPPGLRIPGVDRPPHFPHPRP